MSGEDKTIMAPVEIPGMQITFQSPLGTKGKGVSFVIAADALIPPAALNERLDVIAAASRRQHAAEELREDLRTLAANRKLLIKARLERDKAEAKMQAKLAVVRGTRRGEPDPSRNAPHDIGAISQWNNTVIEIEGQITGCEERIPFWRAILRGEDPADDEFPMREAAE